MDFNDICIEVDSECVNQDFDDVDLYGEKLIEEADSNILFE